MNKEIIPYSVETLISEKDIKKRITELGEDINHFYKDTKKLLVVGLLRGSFVFIADLARELKIPVEVDFMTASSYGNSMQSSKFLRIFFPKYYLFGLVLSLTGLIIAIFDKNNMSLIVFLLIIIGFLFSRQFLMPIINKAKDNNNEKKFNILHRVSVLINFIQISLCVFLLIIFLK